MSRFLLLAATLAPCGALDVKKAHVALEADPRCRALCFGHDKFDTMRFGSQLTLVWLGMEKAKLRNCSALHFSSKQRKQLELLFHNVPKELIIEDPAPSCPDGYRCVGDPVGKTVRNQLGGPNKPWMVNAHEKMVKYVKPYLRECPNLPDLGDDTLVMHMRSGDVFDVKTDGAVRWPDHTQPPCAFYEEAMQGMNKGIILTEKAANNPCVESMIKKFPGKIELQTKTINEDGCVMINAVNLATSRSLFPLSIMHLNDKLKHVHIPFANEKRTSAVSSWYAEFGWTNNPMPYAQHLYSFGDWDSKGALLDLGLFGSRDIQITKKVIEAKK